MADRRNVLKTGLAASTLLALGAQARGRKAATRPNIIHICTDDMRFDDDRYMRNLKKLFVRKGIQFDCSFVPYPYCAPARASFLTGLQPHNHGIYANDGPNGGYTQYQKYESNALPVWLTDAGYFVGHIGKFINDYDKVAPDHVPPGYADWRVMSSSFEDYFNFRLNENGAQVKYHDGQYTTDVFIQKTLDFLTYAPQPWVLFLWPNCCHGPAIPAPQDAGTFANVDMPLSPNFNEQDVSDKPAFIRDLPLLTDDQIAVIQDLWRGRQETLQSLDRGIAAIVDVLTTSGLIDNTHLLFTSDNGFLEGEHRVNDHKNLLYEESIRIPLYWLVPDTAPARCFAPTSNVDVTAAMVELAQATAGRTLDGRSMVPLLGDPKGHGWNRAVLIQCVRSIGIATERYRYMEWGTHHSREYELYDMKTDPYQLANQADNAAYAQIRSACAQALDAMRDCSGETCSWTGRFPPPPR